MPHSNDEASKNPSQPHAPDVEDSLGDRSSRPPPHRRQSQHSIVAKSALLNLTALQATNATSREDDAAVRDTTIPRPALGGSLKWALSQHNNGVGAALTDTPLSTAPNSPKMSPRTSPTLHAQRKDSGSSTPSIRPRPTTLDIPGLTKSKVSPDGRIAQRDVGAKLVIVMVGLPARGKSYITKKIARYLNWLQHDTRIFNVGARRRVVAASGRPDSPKRNGFAINGNTASLNGILSRDRMASPEVIAAKILMNGNGATHDRSNDILPPPALDPNQPSMLTDSILPNGSRASSQSLNGHANRSINGSHPPESSAETMDQNAEFFDPNNAKAAQLRHQLAMSTLDELLDYILDEGGSVGIFDATNSTLERRKAIMDKIKARAGPELNVLFLESLCVDEGLLESNMRLKLSGPDYKDQDPVSALADFRKRVAMYERKYVSLGAYEEKNDMPYIQMIDVGRKVVSHQIHGFLSAQTVYYLLNFNLSPRQIWITRHGQSMDNLRGKIGGDSELSENGHRYARALTRFIKQERQIWEVRQEDKARSTHFPPQPGDSTPPNPEYSNHGDDSDNQLSKNFCVWTSMLQRSIQTAEYFDEDEFDLKQMKMLDELNAGRMEGMTYEQIRTTYTDEYELRKRDKLHYRYPGAGGEGYLDIINRLRAVIVEVERMTDHVLLVGHRSVARVLLAYFMGLKREDVADLDVPLGMLYMLEPKPYGVEFKAYRYDSQSDSFDMVPNYELHRSNGPAE
ncbi:hypothetical protein MMC25_000843 [Agyrium rufum]|nr:hypothetical protein [Agyrium rufum]